MMKYDEFKQKKKSIDDQQKQLKKKSSQLKKQKMQVKLDQFNKQREVIRQKMNQFVNSPSEYD